MSELVFVGILANALAQNRKKIILPAPFLVIFLDQILMKESLLKNKKK